MLLKADNLDRLSKQTILLSPYCSDFCVCFAFECLQYQ